MLLFFRSEMGFFTGVTAASVSGSHTVPFTTSRNKQDKQEANAWKMAGICQQGALQGAKAR